MDFLYRNIHMEQKKWETSTQITIEEDINVPDAKGDCMSLLLKEAVLHVDETRVGRDQVTVRGKLQYQILYETGIGGRLEQMEGSIPFEEVINVKDAAPGDLAAAKGVVEDFRVSMINTRKIAVQSVVMLYVCMHQLMEEEWTDEIVNCGNDVQKYFVPKEVMQLCQKKSDVFRIKEEIELPGGYPAIQNVLWKYVSLGNVETRPMDGKISLKGELNCFFIYVAQGVTQAVKMLTKKIPFHGLIECSGCQSDSVVSNMAVLNQYSAEVKSDSDGEDRYLYLEAALDLQIRVYCDEKVMLLKDIYSTTQEIIPEEKTVHAPMLHIAGEGKCKLRQTHRIKEGNSRALQILHTSGTIFPDREQWEDGKLMLMGSVLCQVLYMTGEEEMPYAVTECMLPYSMEMESGVQDGEIPDLYLEPRIEQLEASLVDSEEMEIKAILAFSVLALSSEKETCIGDAQCQPLDTMKFASLPGMVVCFADKDTTLWEYGKRYYMPVEEMKRLNNITGDILKTGESMLLVKGAKE